MHKKDIRLSELEIKSIDLDFPYEGDGRNALANIIVYSMILTKRVRELESRISTLEGGNNTQGW
jgi:hypothetical protein